MGFYLNAAANTEGGYGILNFFIMIGSIIVVGLVLDQIIKIHKYLREKKRKDEGDVS